MCLWLHKSYIKQQVSEFARHLKAVPRAVGVDEILLSGELEWRTRDLRLRTGIPLPEVTWERIRAAGAEAGVAVTSESLPTTQNVHP
jgi:LDH2 family malate/lactate/ureidoglycolate dehydrogenase